MNIHPPLKTKATLLSLLLAAPLAASAQDHPDRAHGHAMFQEAMGLLDRDKPDEAIRRLRTIHRSDSLYERSLLLRARAHSSMDDLPGAEAACTEGLALGGALSGQFMVMRAAVLLDLKKHDATIAACDSAIAELPGNFRARHLKALALAGKGDRRAALQQAMDNALRFPYQRDAHALLGAIAQSEDRVAEAALAYMMAQLVRFDDRKAEQMLVAYDKCLGGSVEPSREGFDLSITGDDLDEITLLIKSKVAMEKKYKVKPDLPYPTCRQSHLLLTSIANRKTARPGFYERFYGPMARAIVEQGWFAPYVFHCLAASSVPTVKAHAEKNKAKVAEFRKWAAAFMEQHYLTFPEAEGGPALLHVYNDDNNLLAVGQGDAKTGSKTGEWTAYNGQGRISGRGAFNARGEREGRWTHWGPNGRVESVGDFRDGKLHGVAINHFANGNMKDSTTFREGKRHGIGIIYYPMGGRSTVKTAADGQWTGPASEWHRAGMQEWDYALKNDKPDGPVQQRFADGSTQFTGEYKDGQRVGMHLEYHPNGQRAEETTYAAGKAEGPFKAWHPNGQLAREGSFKGGLLSGERRMYDEWGTLRQIDRFGEGGKLNGVREEFNPDGTKLLDLEYRNDLLVRYAYYHRDGRVLGQATRSKGRFQLKGYHPDGALRVEGVYLDEGAKDGTWRYYHADGTLDGEEHFEQGKATGTHKYYDESGALSKEEVWYERAGAPMKSVTWYHPSGAVREKAQLRSGNAEGVVRRYHPDGTLRNMEYFANGDREGWQVYNDPDGKPVYAERIEQGAIAERVSYDEQGREYERIVVRPGAFTMVAHYPNGKEMMRLELMNGVLHGKALWLYPDGSQEVAGEYLNGSRHGAWVSHHPNGKKRSAITYRLGKEEGVSKWWYLDGTLRMEIPMRDGERHGVIKEFHPNGKLAFARAYEHGELHGPTLTYSLDGTPQLARFYHKGALVAYGSPLADGSVRDTIPLEAGIARLESKFTNGKVSRRMTYRNGELDGEFIEYHPNGQVMERSVHRAGKVEGTSTSYYPDGKVMEAIPYVDGLMHGERVTYWENGQVRERITYAYGEMHGTWSVHDRTGKRIALYRTRNDDVVEIGK